MHRRKRKKLIIALMLITSIVISLLTVSFAVLSSLSVGEKNYSLTVGNLDFEIQNETNSIRLINAYPMSDEDGQKLNPYTFTLKNTGDIKTYYQLYLIEDEEQKTACQDCEFISLDKVKYALTIDGEMQDAQTINTSRRLLDTGTLVSGDSKDYELRLWVSSDVTAEDENKYYFGKIYVEAFQTQKYKEEILNGTDPVLTTNLVPVLISDDGTVTKADINEQWYSYANQEWANAVVLTDNTQTYENGATIPEENIESYFVWIPRYRYKIFDEGNYDSLTDTEENAVQTIEVEFETKDVEASTGTTEGSWLTHPAFTTFNSNGMWVGKFETGYDDATTTEEAQVDSNDSAKLIIKPNVYSWRGISIGNAFKASYDYMREEDSHMMKNTEWGAVAYLHHSNYGSRASVRVNNNSAHITGYAAIEEPTEGYSTTSISGNQYGTAASVTLPYNTTTGYTASTTGNISGVYDMSGGTIEYVMGYNTAADTVGGLSGLTGIYENFFTSAEWEKYYDRYNVTATTNLSYNSRILGDATGEMGSFRSVDGTVRYRGSWYDDYAYFVSPESPWFPRGSGFNYGVLAGVFAFSFSSQGGVSTGTSFRVVLTP